jgi:hypothetical protein
MKEGDTFTLDGTDYVVLKVIGETVVTAKIGARRWFDGAALERKLNPPSSTIRWDFPLAEVWEIQDDGTNIIRGPMKISVTTKHVGPEFYKWLDLGLVHSGA